MGCLWSGAGGYAFGLRVFIGSAVLFNAFEAVLWVVCSSLPRMKWLHAGSSTPKHGVGIWCEIVLPTKRSCSLSTLQFPQGLGVRTNLMDLQHIRNRHRSDWTTTFAYHRPYLHGGCTVIITFVIQASRCRSASPDLVHAHV